MEIPIVKPPWQGLGRRLEKLTRKACYEFKLLEDVDKLAIALSGGKDSLSLLYLLKALSGHGFPKIDLYAIHISGAFSCGASVQVPYLQKVCDQLDVPLIVRSSEQKLETLECYRCSRERRRLLFDAAKEVGATTIAFGHHRDDSIQTLMMNLLHKAEFVANLPKIHMHKFGITIIRPLIYVPEESLQRFAEQYHFSRVVCRCPKGQSSMRKKAKILIDEIEELFPNAKHNLHLAGLQYGSRKAQVS